MYQLGKVQRRSHKRLIATLVLLLVLLLGAAAVAAKYVLKPHTVVSQSAAVTKAAVLPNAEKYQTVKGASFSLEVPTTWKAVTPLSSAYTLYRWQGTTVNDAQRWIDIYVDTIPSNFAVNHMLPIQAAGNAVTVLNSVSDNCADFTDASKVTPKPATAPAKWSGISFNCDLANYERDVVGTATTEGSAVVLKGVSGSHHYFFTYTDNSITPDYTVFTRQLESFKSL